MIGMPAANRIECTGRSPVDVPSMFNESIPSTRDIGGDESLGSGR